MKNNVGIPASQIFPQEEATRYEVARLLGVATEYRILVHHDRTDTYDVERHGTLLAERATWTDAMDLVRDLIAEEVAGA